jgi:Ca2+-binding RTX toxin-like protein
LFLAVAGRVAWAATIDGTNRDDTLVGTSQADFIRGFRGADDMYGRAGNDTLRGGPGNDRIIAGTGNNHKVYARDGYQDLICVDPNSSGTIVTRDPQDRLVFNRAC